MALLNDKELERSYLLWLRKDYRHRAADEKVFPFLRSEMKSFTYGDGSWLKMVRSALFMSTGHLAEKLNISRAAYSKFEKSEQMGSISLKNLARAAEALNCELVYGLRPKRKILFSEVVWNKLIATALKHTWVKSRPQGKKAEALAAAAKWAMDDPEFKRSEGWSERDL